MAHNSKSHDAPMQTNPYMVILIRHSV